VVVTGCYAQHRPEDLLNAGADLVVGNQDKADLVDRVEDHLQGRTVPEVSLGIRPEVTKFLSIDGSVPTGRTRGTLQVQDGCDEHCTYCIIPSVRGAGVSRRADEVVDQARRMAAAGYRELALTGVHTGSYGRDRGEEEALVALLEALEEVAGLERLRLNSIEPAFVTDSLIDLVAGSDKICRHFHVPLQSGDDAVLRRMGRRYDRDLYADRVGRIARQVPGCAIGADVMVGFPGEGQEQFASTYSLIDELPLTYLHVFSYSSRDGTPATRLSDHQSRATKTDRSRQLIELGRSKRLDFHRRHLGQTVQALVEERTDAASGLRVGLTDNYIKVLFAGGPAANEMACVRLQQARDDLACGEVVDP
jgi:threonylcarbamoyladenosine tRNA methylthiotransferase MtaB